MSWLKDIKKDPWQKRLEKIAEIEGVTKDYLSEGLLAGRIVVPFNPIHSPSQLMAIGKGVSVKVNANIGTSEKKVDIAEELKKVKVSVESKANSIMDLSTGGNLNYIRKEIIKNSPLPVGTVPVYQAFVEARAARGSYLDVTENDILKVIEKQAQDGVDFMTIHAGINWRSLRTLEKQGRVTGIVSRGGALLAAWMTHHQKENPLYEHFDRVLELADQYDFVISLGDALRPGSLADATDRAQIEELVVLGELVKEARRKEVQVMVEGPGHVPLNQIEENIRLQKSLTEEAPFYVLGPLVTDIGAGYDHIVSAIGGALAAYYGADFLCYVTPSEHLRLPNVNDVREGIMASRIAAHAADLARGYKRAWDWDLEMAEARTELNWEKQIKLSIDPLKASQLRRSITSDLDEVCSMCGEYCAMKIVRDYLNLPKVKGCF